MTRVTVFTKQVISGNYSYLQTPSPRTNYTRLGATVKANNCRMKRQRRAGKFGGTMIFFQPSSGFEKQGVDLRPQKMSRLPVRWCASRPPRRLRVYFWTNFDVICYVTEKRGL